MGRIKRETEQEKNHKAYSKEFRERATPIYNKYITGATFGKYHERNPKSKALKKAKEGKPQWKKGSKAHHDDLMKYEG